MRIHPLSDLGSDLLNIEKPGRYVGGEFGIYRKEDADFTMAIAFPDLYEIGMSNQAIRILYNYLNHIEGVFCDRVFCPAPDFEELLKKREIPLYTLDLGIPLYELDMIGFSLGYELGITGVLTILQSGKIPVLKKERSEQDPIIIMGGPAVSNPIPYESFIDAFWIGEAENNFFELVKVLRDHKKKGASKKDLLAILWDCKHIWMPGKTAVRSIYTTFGKNDRVVVPVFPVPNIKIVQDHGAVEIMRGCPNGCRFCHAGIWYRPMRQKDADTIIDEVKEFIQKGGYREITLSSLSSGDYQGIDELLSALNTTYKHHHISFQLPSLKVSSFSLPLLEQIAETRKSGLTFAVETPYQHWQWSLNKEVTCESVIAILKEAKNHGWRSAKFYFMIGLPVGSYEEGYEYNKEEEAIVDFITSIVRAVKIEIHINVGTFVPKPHTPYQWVAQISSSLAEQKLQYIRHNLRPLGIKVSTHDPFISEIEGILSRGDSRVGEIIYKAFLNGCRLDSWDEYFKRERWQQILGDFPEIVQSALRKRSLEEELPWDSIASTTGKGFLKKELLRSRNSELTLVCSEKCTNPCGACNQSAKIVHNNRHVNNKEMVCEEKKGEMSQGLSENDGSSFPNKKTKKKRDTYRIVFSFTKQSRAIFIPHLGLMEVFSKALVRSGLSVHFTEGFNPLPAMDFAAPLSLGIASQEEIATIEMEDVVPPENFLAILNTCLPEGICITRAELFVIPEGVKKYSSPALLWGSCYRIKGSSTEIFLPSKEDKKIKELAEKLPEKLLAIERTRTLAYNPQQKNLPSDFSGASYFMVYSELYKGFQEKL
ncbi:MAG: TIGR03936 family radical SAM-associated protein [Treponemataceae bacterium]|nr:TIGR03936 family radical SAM-associated protein [Treponemataceae bacterium]